VTLPLFVAGLQLSVVLAGAPVAQAAEPVTAVEAVRALAGLPDAIPGVGRSDGSDDPVEDRRAAVYERLRTLGSTALPAVLDGLKDRNVSIRRNVALFLGVGAPCHSMADTPKQVQTCVAKLALALRDSDLRTRHLAGQAIGAVGPAAKSAVPALIDLLASDDEGSRNSACIGLAGIGPGAATALPALRRTLTGSSPTVQRFAQSAIDSIETQR